MFQQTATRTSISRSINQYFYCPGTCPEEIKGKKSSRLASVTNQKTPEQKSGAVPHESTFLAIQTCYTHYTHNSAWVNLLFFTMISRKIPYLLESKTRFFSLNLALKYVRLS